MEIENKNPKVLNWSIPSLFYIFWYFFSEDFQQKINFIKMFNTRRNWWYLNILSKVKYLRNMFLLSIINTSWLKMFKGKN